MQKRNRVIGLCGPEGAGKSTVASILKTDHGFVVAPFAGPLKGMMRALGVPDRNLFGTPADKEAPLDILCGKSARQGMQWLGTEWGRNLIGPSFWVNAWRANVDNLGCNVVSDDLRFSNEADAVRALGGQVWCVVRSENDFERVPKHASENFAAIRRDVVIYNDRGLADLRLRVLARVQSLACDGVQLDLLAV